MNLPVPFIFGYLVFVFFIFFISTYGGIVIFENVPPPPQFPTSFGNVWDVVGALTYPIQVLVYFYQFVFITSYNYPFMSILLVPAAIIIALFIAMVLIEFAKALGLIIPG